MKFKEWQAKHSIEAAYRQSLNNLIRNFFKKAEIYHIVDPNELIDAFKDYCQSGNFSAYVNAAASRMTTGLIVDSAKTWRRAAAESMKGPKIYEFLKQEMQGPTGARIMEIVNRNAMLIQSLPGDVAVDLNKFIQSEALKGSRSKEIQSGLRYMPNIQDVRARVAELTEARIALIARTETSKASTALTRSRSEDMGLDWYMWRTSGDIRVRTSHREMNRVLVSWSDAPSPERLVNEKSNLGHYHAGECPNCRCYTQPVININRIEWPAKVHRSGSIIRMTKNDFENMLNPLKRAA